MFDLLELRERYQRNLFDSVIPFWLNHSLDLECGGQLNCLTRDGRVYDSRKYVWMMGRAVWMFSRLYNQVERRQEWLDAAHSILEFLLRHARDAEGRCYFSVTRDGRPVFFQRKPYAAFFLALALIEYSKTGAPAEGYIEQAKELFRLIREWIDNATPLGRPHLPGQTPCRQLADVMVIASLALELHEVEPEANYVRILENCWSDARAHWLPEKRTLLENLPLDGSDYRESPVTRQLCPGSAMEVAWMLWHSLEKRNAETPENVRFLLDVMEGSLEFGWDKDYGGLYYFLDSEGFPAQQLEANMKLWWPHTEAIVALTLAYSKTKDPRWLTWLERIDEYTFRTFVDWEHGEWLGYCDRRGAPALDLKGGPYKGFFHVPRALLFSMRRLDTVIS
ncbi:MAG: AGE family epimerase/isomerase [Candidatus Solibacter usitatus]|nr:AGE family epimerase/isomerase [Candidatus Solibacter usitatus]